MKRKAETIFANVAKESFQATLKPLGFKKKGNNFYLQNDELGHIINFQKSSSNSKDHIRFTINTGVFLPEYWMESYNYFDKPVPAFPTEPECTLRMRIGRLRNEDDKWYDITADTNEAKMINEIKMDLSEYILPHFRRVSSKDKLADFIDSQTAIGYTLEKLTVLGELGETEKAKKEYQKLIAETTQNPRLLKTIQGHGKKYGLV